MPAAVNTAASFWEQFTDPVDTTTATPLPCTITKLWTGGSRVDVAVENPAQTHQTPQGAWMEKNIPWVETGVATPTTGSFVTATDYAPPAPPSGDSGSGDGSGSSGN